MRKINIKAHLDRQRQDKEQEEKKRRQEMQLNKFFTLGQETVVSVKAPNNYLALKTQVEEDHANYVKQEKHLNWVKTHCWDRYLKGREKDQDKMENQHLCANLTTLIEFSQLLLFVVDAFSSSELPDNVPHLPCTGSYTEWLNATFTSKQLKQALTIPVHNEEMKKKRTCIIKALEEHPGEIKQAVISFLSVDQVRQEDPNDVQAFLLHQVGSTEGTQTLITQCQSEMQKLQETQKITTINEAQEQEWKQQKHELDKFMISVERSLDESDEEYLNRCAQQWKSQSQLVHKKLTNIQRLKAINRDQLANREKKRKLEKYVQFLQNVHHEKNHHQITLCTQDYTQLYHHWQTKLQPHMSSTWKTIEALQASF